MTSLPLISKLMAIGRQSQRIMAKRFLSSDLIMTNYELYIEKLVKSGIDIKQAKVIVTTLDNAIQNRLNQEILYFVNVSDYHSVVIS